MRWWIVAIVVLLALEEMHFLPRSLRDFSGQASVWVFFAAVFHLLMKMGANETQKDHQFAIQLGAEYTRCPEPDFLEQFQDPPG
jgi:hypothetical protein